LSKKFYETYIIIDGNLDDNAVADSIAKYEALFAKNEIQVLEVNKIGRRRLAYPIKRRQNGYYVCFEIMSNPGVLTKIERAYQLDENVLRYLSIFVSDRTKKEKDAHFKHKALQEEAKLAELQKAQAKEDEKPVEAVTENVEN
jgi:small subunit ribosomal protein S6